MPDIIKRKREFLEVVKKSRKIIIFVENYPIV